MFVFHTWSNNQQKREERKNNHENSQFKLKQTNKQMVLDPIVNKTKQNKTHLFTHTHRN